MGSKNYRCRYEEEQLNKEEDEEKNLNKINNQDNLDLSLEKSEIIEAVNDSVDFWPNPNSSLKFL